MAQLGPELNRDWIGLRVRLLGEVQTFLCKIPSGTKGTIGAYGAGRRGIRFDADPCIVCGVAASSLGLKRRDFRILSREEDWPDTRGRGRG